MTGAAATQFASDNYAGICPEAWAALAAANAGHAGAYGADDWTAAAVAALQRTFETDCSVWFVFNGTAANALALAAICRPSDAIVCHEMAHVNVDECGAPGFFSGGAVLRTADTPHAKLTPEAVERLAVTPHDEHSSRPRALALTQATELGTVYTPLELWQLADCAHGLGMKVQLDGARFANAVATLGCHPSDITWRAGVDVLCFGGTKNGLPVGEAVVFFDRALSEDFAWRVKQAGQLASKMRFISAPWLGLLENDTWLANARHANAMAARLHAALREVPGVELLHAPQANAVFARLPQPAVNALHAKGWRFYQFIAGGGCRFMCSWDTRPESVDAFAADIRHVCGG